ncbi:protein PFC0760c-like [Ctenocephalides felis]|uniref:protein PFC0760c-like n=1 Tax=Ctenocephalides felis TaxID=7515 RepID=UPI000E6E2617|nr:protein PFC0760c-like [Ctenocephalides felis]
MYFVILIYFMFISKPVHSAILINKIPIIQTGENITILNSLPKFNASKAINELQTSLNGLVIQKKIFNKTLGEQNTELNHIIKSVENFPEGNWTRGIINIGDNPPHNFILSEKSSSDSSKNSKSEARHINNFHAARDLRSPTRSKSLNLENEEKSEQKPNINLTEIIKSLKAKVSDNTDRYLCTPAREYNNELYTTDDIIITFGSNVDNEELKLLVFRNNVTEPLNLQNIDDKSIIIICTKIANCTQPNKTNTLLTKENFSKLISDALTKHDKDDVTFNINEGTNNYNLYTEPFQSAMNLLGNPEERYKIAGMHYHAQEEHMKNNENILRNILFELTRLNDLQWYQYINNQLPHLENSERLNIYSRSNPINTPSFAHHPLEEISNMIKFVLHLENYATENGNSNYNPRIKSILKNLIDKIDHDKNNTNKPQVNHKVDDINMINQTWDKSQLDFIIETIENLIDGKDKTEKNLKFTKDYDDIIIVNDTQANVMKKYRLVSERRLDEPASKIRKALQQESSDNLSKENDNPDLEVLMQDSEKYKQLFLNNKTSNSMLQPGVEIQTSNENSAKPQISHIVVGNNTEDMITDMSKIKIIRQGGI